MPDRGRVAVLMPVFQAQREFDETMSSLRNSSTPCTVFVVDDGSQPPLDAREYGPPLDVHLSRLPRNLGIVAALNAGLKAAIEQGYEYIARIDAGDFASPDRLARQIAYLEAHPGCMLVGSDAEVRRADGSYCFTIEPPRDPSVLAEALHERAWILHPTVMYRASIFREMGLYSDRFPAAEDYEMFLRIASRHEIGVVPEPLLIYVLRKGSISSMQARKQAISRLRLQFLYFRWTSIIAWYGLLRTCGILIMPRWVKHSFKLKFLYSRIPARHSSDGRTAPLEARTRS
jgi:glycosyltransferase involved in cell wall biosynthesis